MLWQERSTCPEYTISIFCVYDAKKPKQKRNLPFQSLARLQENGESWTADPAGWLLGRTNLSLSDSSLEYKPGKQTTENLKSSEYRDFAGRTVQANNSPHSQHGSVASKYKNQNGEDSDGEDSDEDSEVPTGYFREMSFNELYGVHSDSSRLENRSLRGNVTDNDSNDDMEEHGVDTEEKISNFLKMKDIKQNDDQTIMITKPIDQMGEMNARGRFACLMISNFTKPLLDKMGEEAKKAASYLNNISKTQESVS
ncbi:hypothetical protein E1B28_007949 [Marasmius oreades]|uniref:Uncharacterized protein n=1 Tax=Marasmius oreades TaxID=181124 RepID=A0A9P7S2R4_9AGAR|nr:uncharacterized protein E1B28_007949 [Marasmius oreades]KAG7094349.1 hypothetical protein E1B28_007949 [Marasmius oreades]